MLPTSTYCSQFIVSPQAAKSFCNIVSKHSGSSHIKVILSAISITLSMLYCASGAISRRSRVGRHKHPRFQFLDLFKSLQIRAHIAYFYQLYFCGALDVIAPLRDLYQFVHIRSLLILTECQYFPILPKSPHHIHSHEVP